MKLLMENWRRYLTEQEPVGKCMTVRDRMVAIAQFQKEEDSEKILQKGKDIAASAGAEGFKALVGEIPLVGAAVTAAEFINNTKKTLEDKPVDLDDLEDFPVLQKLKADPNLVRVIDPDVLNQIDDKYLSLLKGIKPESCIEDVPDINEFIRIQIRADTHHHVVITDESEEPAE